ncbi:MAG TPA: 50S ribosomal protein L5 [Patescibacteria group bacterium]|nr:50S ribosomal protein L5 [Patescibacteria group bacterium]
MKARLEEQYEKSIVPTMTKEFAYKNSLAVPRLQKAVVNIGLKEAKDSDQVITASFADLAAITGQKPVVTKAKKSIAGFKLRAGQPVGVKVTLRGQRMYDFVDKLFQIVLPRVRDFRGLPEEGFDGRGNYTLGLTEQIVFPEIDYNKIDKVRSLEVTLVTTAKTDKEGVRLLELMGMPIRRKDGGK